MCIYIHLFYLFVELCGVLCFCHCVCLNFWCCVNGCLFCLPDGLCVGWFVGLRCVVVYVCQFAWLYVDICVFVLCLFVCICRVYGCQCVRLVGFMCGCVHLFVLWCECLWACLCVCVRVRVLVCLFGVLPVCWHVWLYGSRFVWICDCVLSVCSFVCVHAISLYSDMCVFIMSDWMVIRLIVCTFVGVCVVECVCASVDQLGLNSKSFRSVMDP